MNTKNSTGRSIAILAGVYFIGKSVLNLILGGGFWDIIISALEAAAIIVGLMFTNYIVAVVLLVVALTHLIPNISHLFEDFRYIIYLLEGVIDIIIGLVLCAVPSVREHCTNTPAEIFGDSGNNGN